ncbi:MAG: hypothetical protein AB1489_17475 [Acidobacteriota bacterium]
MPVKLLRGINYGSLVETIAAVREAGIDRIGLVTEKEKSEK